MNIMPRFARGDMQPGSTQDQADDYINGDPDGPPASREGECRSPWCSSPVSENSQYLCARHHERQVVQ